PTPLYTLSLHDALPILAGSGLAADRADRDRTAVAGLAQGLAVAAGDDLPGLPTAAARLVVDRVLAHAPMAQRQPVEGPRGDLLVDRKSTRLNSSHVSIS